MKTHFNLFSACTVLIMSAGRLSADDPGPVITPDIIVQQALVYSPVLKMSGEAVTAAVARHRQAVAEGWPSVELAAYASRYEGLEDSVFGPANIIPAIDNRYGGSIRLRQPLYTGGRISARRDGALLQRQSAEWDRNSARADLALQALTAYWNWSKAHYSVRAFADSLSWMEAHARDMKNLREAGLATENDALATEVQMEQTRLRLEEARHRVELARAQLTYLTGRIWPVEARPMEAPEPHVSAMSDEQASLQAAFSNRTERRARQSDIRSAEAAVQGQHAGLFPQVTAQAGYEQARPNPLDIPPADEWEDDAFIGVALAWNIFDGGLTRAKMAEASAQLQQTRLQAELLDDGIALEVRQARIGVDDALTRVRVAGSAVRSAELNLASASDLWTNGMARHSEVLDAQARLTDAQFEWTTAKADAELATAAFLRALGEWEDPEAP